MDKEKWLVWAELIDCYRIFPRLMWLIVAFGYFWFSYDLYTWIKGMEVLSEVAVMFAGGTISALGGVLMLVTNKYFDSGTDWSKKNDS